MKDLTNKRELANEECRAEKLFLCTDNTGRDSTNKYSIIIHRNCKSRVLLREAKLSVPFVGRDFFENLNLWEN